jgi:hypothetical protein
VTSAGLYFTGRQTKVVRLLLEHEHGADVNVRGEDGDTVLVSRRGYQGRVCKKVISLVVGPDVLNLFLGIETYL